MGGVAPTLYQNIKCMIHCKSNFSITIIGFFLFSQEPTDLYFVLLVLSLLYSIRVRTYLCVYIAPS